MNNRDFQIVIVDGKTLNPGDLSWDGFRALGEVALYDGTPPDDLLGRTASTRAIITNKVRITAEAIRELPALEYIGVTATGYDVVDVAAARKRRITVTNVPTYGTASVAQTTMALLLELTQHVGQHDQAVKAGRWSESDSFCFWDTPLVELAGRTMGIVGLGRIGRAVAGLAAAFGMQVIAHTRAHEVSGKLPDFPVDIRAVDIDTLFRTADVVSLHCPLSADTANLVDRARLATMKPTAYLINASRGPLVVEQDLRDALDHGVIAGAALDVLASEPPPRDNVLLGARNCIITPHIAWATLESRARLLDISVANLQAHLRGNPQNVVG